MKPDLISKYNVPGPRYTSYPTVPFWSETPDESTWLKSIQKNLLDENANGNHSGMAIYIHIPFCESLCTYCGCNQRITKRHEMGLPYIQTVLKEWALYRSHLPARPLVSEIHLGGGTPTFLSPDELNLLIKGILNGVEVTPDHEFSIEADPRVTSAAHLETLAGLGFTRMSLGIQDFDPKVQKTVNREQSEAQVATVVDGARKAGFQSINFDLIYGLPHQTLQSVERTFESVVRLRPERIAYYSYAHVPWIKPGQRLFTEADLPGGETKRALYELGRRLLEGQGYEEIGMDHFALPIDSLSIAAKNGSLHRNFMGYTSRRVSPLIGLGVSAIGDSWDAFMQNEKILEKYSQRVEQGVLPILRGHSLGEEDLILRRHILNLMTRFETRWDDPKLHTDHLAIAAGKLKTLADDGLVRVDETGCRILEAGRPFLRNVCMAFDARLSRNAPSTQIFSRTT